MNENTPLSEASNSLKKKLQNEVKDAVHKIKTMTTEILKELLRADSPNFQLFL